MSSVLATRVLALKTEYWRLRKERDELLWALKAAAGVLDCASGSVQHDQRLHALALIARIEGP